MSEQAGSGSAGFETMEEQPLEKLLEHLASQIDDPTQPGFFQRSHEYPMGMLSLTAYGSLAAGERMVLLKAFGRQDEAGKLLEFREAGGNMVEITYNSVVPEDPLRVQVGDDKEPPEDLLRDRQLITQLYDSFAAEQETALEKKAQENRHE